MAVPAGNTALLADAIRYALGSLADITPHCLPRPTPCSAWDLAALLRHVNDSLAALCEGMVAGYIGLDPAPQTAAVAAGGLAVAIRDRAVRLLAAAATAGNQDIAVADRRLPGSIVTAVGAVEIAVHGWDIATACGYPRPIPPALATGIVRIMPLVVTRATRDVHFAAPVPVSPLASPSDRLVALLGRNPRTPTPP
jgi:uncharacterized protein (TIGR03086 family)